MLIHIMLGYNPGQSARKALQILKPALLAFIIGLYPCTASGQSFDPNLEMMMKLIKENKSPEMPKERIILKNDALFCTGDSSIAAINNGAAELMQKGEWEKAAEALEDAITKSALFFPFRFNLGMCYIHLDQLKRALLHFEKVAGVVPEYYETYIQIAYIFQRWQQDTEAIRYYREALRKNNRNIDTLVMIGDIFYQRHQIEMAKKYYDASLKIDHRFANGILGLAKIHFKRGEFHKAIILFKSIDISKPYDKSYHYYYAESAFKLRDYRAASEQYQTLLGFKNDRFFLTNSFDLIRHKLNLSKRFIER
ncbi:MAG: tetratricopeptide repeat protein [Spirochaetes bacterium]|nr:tetratricopeptide repeat protein [Spirochaetota bacterium]